MSHLIEEHARWLRYAGRSERTIGARRRLLLHADVHLPWGLDQADESELIEYATEADWSQWTRHTYDGHLRGYYQWAVLTGKLTLDPMLHIPKPGEGDRMPNPCSDAELAAALTAPDQPWRAAVMLAAYAGLRCCEIVSVRREHISGGRLRVRGKGKRVRVIPLAPHLLAELEARGPGLLCVGSRRGQPLTPQMLTQMQRAVWRRIGLDDTFRLHRLRHWFATRLLEGGADIRVVQQLLGHASLTSTEGYTQVTNSRMADAVQALPVVEPEPDGSRLGPATAAEAA